MSVSKELRLSWVERGVPLPEPFAYCAGGPVGEGVGRENQGVWSISSLAAVALSSPGVAPHAVASRGRCSLFPLPFSQPQGACG